MPEKSVTKKSVPEKSVPAKSASVPGSTPGNTPGNTTAAPARSRRRRRVGAVTVAAVAEPIDILLNVARGLPVKLLTEAGWRIHYPTLDEMCRAAAMAAPYRHSRKRPAAPDDTGRKTTFESWIKTLDL